MGLALSDLGYQAKVQADEVNPLPEDADCPRAKRPGEVSAKVGESGAWGGGGSMATDVVTRGCRPWKWGSSAPLRLPLPFLGPSVDRRGFVPAPPYTGIPRLSTVSWVFLATKLQRILVPRNKSAFVCRAGPLGLVASACYAPWLLGPDFSRVFSALVGRLHYPGDRPCPITYPSHGTLFSFPVSNWY